MLSFTPAIIDNRFIFEYTGQFNEFNPLVDKLNFDKMLNVINFGVYR